MQLRLRDSGYRLTNRYYENPACSIYCGLFSITRRRLSGQGYEDYWRSQLTQSRDTIPNRHRGIYHPLHLARNIFTDHLFRALSECFIVVGPQLCPSGDGFRLRYKRIDVMAITWRAYFTGKMVRDIDDLRGSRGGFAY